MRPELSIIIPQHRDEENLKMLLDSLKSQRTTFLFEVLIVSNPGSHRASVLSQEDNRFINIDIPQIGVNWARNKGIESAKSGLLFFLDSDCLLEDRDLLQKHFDYHRRYPHVCCLGGMYENSRVAPLDIAYNYLQNRWLLSGGEGEASRHLVGGHFSCKKALLAEQLFDEAIVYGGSETEFFFRLKKIGCVLVLDPKLNVGHRTHLKISDFLKKHYRQGQGARYLFAKHGCESQGQYSGFKTLSFQNQNYKSEISFYIYLAEEAFSLGRKSSKPSFHFLRRLCFYLHKRVQYLFKKFLEIFRALVLLAK